MKLNPLWLSIGAVCTALSCATPAGVVSRSELFGQDAYRSMPRISRDGSQLAWAEYPYREPYRLMIMNLKDGTTHVGKTPDKAHFSGFAGFFWQTDNRHLIYWHSEHADENHHLMEFDPEDGSLVDLTPFANAHAQFLDQDKNRIIYATNNRDERVFDVYQVDLQTRAITQIYENPGNVVDWFLDEDFKVVGVHRKKGLSSELLMRDPATREFKPLTFLPPHFFFLNEVDFLPAHDQLLVRARLENNLTALVMLHPKAQKFEILLSDNQFDGMNASLLHKTGELKWLYINRQKDDLRGGNEAINKKFDDVRKQLGSDFYLGGTDRAFQHWIVSPNSDRVPQKYFLYDQATSKLRFLYNETDDLANRSFAGTEPIEFKARDGMKIYGYFTRPTYSIPNGGKSPPLVVLVHGGPRARDSFGFSSYVQWLATRGYAVLQINFRGSSGYGEKYLKAGDGEWGGKMTSDLIDGKNWVATQGWINPKKVCIMGSSYGAYATLDALWRFPRDFACGIADSGISDLAAMREENPKHWSLFQAEEDNYFPDQGRTRALLNDRSPLFHAKQIDAPLFLAHGTADIRCKESQTNNLYLALKKLHKPVTYLRMPDGGHVRFDQIAYRQEEFLAKYLGGYYEPEDASEVRGDNSE